MLIAQITDLHIGFEPGNPRELNQRRLDAVIDALIALDVRPDLVLATGDVSDKAELESYERVREALGRLPFPAFVLPGNHDDRANFRQAFTVPPGPDGFIQYVLEDFPVRIVVLDTLEEGLHGAGFCQVRAAWLDKALAAEPHRQTLIALHHPPADTGIPWMGALPGEPWIQRLFDVVSRHPQVGTLISGHMHRPIATPFAGATLIVAPSVAPDLVLTLKAMNLAREDGRPLIELGQPAFALHQWRDGRFLTHFEWVAERKVLARHDAGMKRFLAHVIEERKSAPI